MGKVKNETAAGKAKNEPAAKATKPAPKAKGSARGTGNRFAPFFSNLLRGNLYKPAQGWNARLWTGVGLGLIVAVGVWRIYVMVTNTTKDTVTQYTIPALVGLVLAWVLFRILHYPPFADFLIATEAEMNKVSWTTRNDLYKATSVVLVTVLLLSVYLFAVDKLWSSLLQIIGVVKFQG